MDSRLSCHLSVGEFQPSSVDLLAAPNKVIWQKKSGLCISSWQLASRYFPCVSIVGQQNDRHWGALCHHCLQAQFRVAFWCVESLSVLPGWHPVSVAEHTLKSCLETTFLLDLSESGASKGKGVTLHLLGGHSESMDWDRPWHPQSTLLPKRKRWCVSTYHSDTGTHWEQHWLSSVGKPPWQLLHWALHWGWW